MTAIERSDLDRAILRAQGAGIVILARGSRKVDGARIWGVTSKTTHDGRLHQVTLINNRLVCDCAGAQHGRYCQHRAVVHQALVAASQASRKVA